MLGRLNAGIQAPKHSYEQFLAARPIFLWRDPFGRLMRFTNNDFLPVYLAEPVIYVYPTTAQRVHVEAKPLHSIKASIPPYRGGWDVVALPSGELAGVTDRKKYSYLFWEGLSSISPMRQEGFVIPQEEVPRFFEWMLDRKSTRLNSSHRCISYAVFCLKKKKKKKTTTKKKNKNIKAGVSTSNTSTHKIRI